MPRRGGLCFLDRNLVEAVCETSECPRMASNISPMNTALFLPSRKYLAKATLILIDLPPGACSRPTRSLCVCTSPVKLAELTCTAVQHGHVRTATQCSASALLRSTSSYGVGAIVTLRPQAACQMGSTFITFPLTERSITISAFSTR